MTARPVAALAAAAIAALPAAGCASAVKHPAITAGIVGGTLGFGTCKLASDSYPACLGVGAGAGAFLAIVAATAIWLGGEGNTVMVEEQAQPLPDARPRHRRPASDAAAPATDAVPGTAPPANPAPASPPAGAPSVTPPSAPPASPSPSPATPASAPPS